MNEPFKIKRLVLKEDDILVIKVPQRYMSLADRIADEAKKITSNKKCGLLLIPEDVNLEVLSSEDIREKLGDEDIWNLFEKEEINADTTRTGSDDSE
jgi:hypothetical protein